MNYTLTKYVYRPDCMLPLLRPDSIVRLLTPGLWGLWTPSCWPIENTEKPILAMCDTAEPLVDELKKVGKVELINNEYQVVGELKDPRWWQHRAEDGQLNGLDLSRWGIEVRN